MYRRISISRRCFVLATVVHGAVGCAAVDYIPPSSGPRATLTVQTTNPSINTPVRVHGEQCSIKSGAARLVGRLNTRTIGDSPTGSTLTFDVPAGELLGVSVVASRMSLGATTIQQSWCDRIVDFRPEDGARYLLRVDVEEHLHKCSYRLSRFSVDVGDFIGESAAATRAGCSLPLN
jgi:hypothetical protein